MFVVSGTARNVQRDLLGRRLASQKLARSTFRTPAEVVAWMGGVQAQDYPGAKWAVGIRAARLTNDDVERAFDAGAILRTHVLRPTWHFVAPADIRWMLALTGPRVNAASAYQYRKAGLDDGTFRRSRVVLERALRDRRALTRLELAVALRRAGVAAEGPRLAGLLMRAELDGVICSGPRLNRQFTYALLEERVPPAAPLAPDEALAELTRRYFSSHGPATVADFVWWSGLTVREAKRGLALSEHSLASTSVNGEACWSAAVRPHTRRASPSAFLLPNWDEYVVAYRNRTLLAGGGAAPAAGLFSPSIVIDGKLAGTWTRTLKGSSIHLQLRPHRRFAQREARGVEAAVERYGRFMGMDVRLSAAPAR